MRRILSAVCTVLFLAAAPSYAEVTRVSIASRTTVAGGQPFGSTGPYEKLTGTIEFALDVNDPHNRAIVDLALAARGADGRVHFSADLFVLQPVDSSKGNGVLLFEVSNRGGKGLLGRFNKARGSADPVASEDFGDGLLMRDGYTLVWVGWEFDIAQGIKVNAPAVTLPTGQPVAPMSVSFVLDTRAAEATLSREAPRYPPADPHERSATLTVRDRFWDRPLAIARDRWRFVPNDAAAKLALDGGFEPGRLYEVSYRPAGSHVAGVGLAALRDTASAFRYRTDLPVRGRHTYIYGSSQSGRVLRQFLHDGFNADEKNRRAFDAVWAHIAGAARGSFNERFATPNNLSPYVATQFPFTDAPQGMPGGTDRGLLTSYTPEQRPKVFYTNTSVEYWGLGRAAALTHTTADGAKDIALPDNVRIYLLAGTQHGEAAFPPQRSNGQLPPNPTPQASVFRALLHGLDKWTRQGAAPPESRYPRLNDGTLAAVEKLTFPALPGAGDPRTITGPAVTTARGVMKLPHLVSQVDADGNELGGIRVPELAVPLATTTGWNFRSERIGNPGDIVNLMGSYIPFARTRAEREAAKDPRRSIEERYASRDSYLEQIKSAALVLVKGGYLLPEDVDDVVARAGRHWDHATGSDSRR